VNTRLVADGELAERDTREMLQPSPIEVTDQPLDHMQPVQTVLGPDELGDEEDLDDSVGGVDQLDNNVAGDEVVAVVAAAEQAERLGDEVSDAHHEAATEVALRDEVAVHLIDDVPNCFLAHLYVTSQMTSISQRRILSNTSSKYPRLRTH